MSVSINRHKLITLTHPDSPHAEAYRALRTNIQYAGGVQERKIVAVTSARPREGKSVTIANLAIQYARSGMQVLIVDAQLREPVQHQLFSITNRPGLTEVLNQDIPYDLAIHSLEVPNLSLMPAGEQCSAPSEQLGSSRMLTLLEQLRTRFDMVLLDTACMLDISDSQELSALCDGVVVVLRAGKSRQEDARQAMVKLERVRAKIVGVVLNHI